MGDAYSELAALGPDGIQLTPGNVPTPGFAIAVARGSMNVRTHHGFAWHDRCGHQVWNEGRCESHSDSVHAPEHGRETNPGWRDELLAHDRLPVLETMYPGFALGKGGELGWAMDHGLALAVDVSHVYIQQCQGVISYSTWRRLQNYEHVAEIHVSANDGRSDAHQLLSADTFGLDWALDRSADGVPLVLECYMHKISDSQRRAQLALATGGPR